jgi:hypothetical protein|tara:strand:+ start:16 stop:222 length:207 start_codon:yes stop_codon:yes gene_type:complete
MTIKLMTQDTKDRIRELEGQKIMLEQELDHLSYFKYFDKKNAEKIADVEDRLFEVEDSIKKLTIGHYN